MSGDTQLSQLLDELQRLPTHQRRQRLRALDAGGTLLASLIDAAAQLTTVEGGRALEATALVVELADESGEVEMRARARRARARALSYAGEFREALGACLEAQRLASEADLPIEQGRARLASMHALGELGRLDEAIVAGTEARRLFLVAEEPSLAARADNNIGIVYQRRDQPRSALECFARARPHLEREPLAFGHLENSRGETLTALNDFAGAEAAFTSALQSFQDAEAWLTAAIAEGNLADLAYRQGRLERALRFFESARRRLEITKSPAHLARLLAEQAEAKAVLGLPRDALREYEQALHELDRCGLSLEAARARCGMGLVLLRLQRFAEAETALAAAATAFDELGHVSAKAKVDLVRAELTLDRGGTREAQRMTLRALSALHDRPAEAAAARLLLSRIADRRQDLETAEAEAAAALAAARHLDLAPLLADALAMRGRLRHRRGALDDAVSDLGEAVAQIERVRGSLQADRLRTAFLGHRSSAHEALVRALLDRGGDGVVAETFAAAEQAKSRSLLDEVHGASDPDVLAASRSSDPAERKLRADLGRLLSELNVLYSRLADVEDHGRASAWQEAVRSREQELELIEVRLASAETTTERRYARPAPLHLVQEAIDDRTALIEFFAAEGEIIAFVITRDAAHVCRGLADATEIASALERLRFQMERALRPRAMEGPRGGRLLADAQRELAELHMRLLAPLSKMTAEMAQWVIVPHGALHLVPFHALWDGQRYVIESHEISYAPSASMLRHLLLAQPARSSSTDRPLVVGVADEVAPRIEEEARRVADSLQCHASRRLLGQDATVERATAGFADASILHLACHGRFLQDYPSSSGVRLSDRWMTVRDICTTRIAADLVTLSGCETGLNLVHAGDELLGLLRSFLIAGADSLLASLWRVDDESTFQFMSQFYDSFLTLSSTPGARRQLLRRVQLNLMQARPHPAHWAPFFLMGRP